MKAKKLIVLLLTAVCVCAFLAACGNKNEPAETSEPADDMSNIATIGEAMALTDEENIRYATYENAFVFVLEQNGTYWRFTAKMTAQESAALSDLDILDEDYNQKMNELVSPLAVSKCENLNEKKLSDDEMKALVGKTGEELVNDGWTSAGSYNLDEMEFYMEYAPFEYTVVFEAKEKLENTDDFDEIEAIKTLKVKSVSFFGPGDHALDLPEDFSDPASEGTSIDYLVLVNKQNKLPDDWEDTVELVDAKNTIPENVELNEDNEYLATDVFKVEKNALEAFRALQADLEEEGIIILLDSTYRSVARQEELWAEFEEEYGLEYTQNTVAVPGTSEHHTGLAIDVCIVKDGEVINENNAMISERDIFSKIHAKLADYGFILRFPENGKDITGYDYEPWHFRYVGIDAAKEIAEQNITLEEYLGVLPEAAE